MYILYITNAWCTNSTGSGIHCSKLVEFLNVKYRPFYLLREWLATIIVVHILCKAKEALRELYRVISKLQQPAHPDSLLLLETIM